MKIFVSSHSSKKINGLFCFYIIDCKVPAFIRRNTIPLFTFVRNSVPSLSRISGVLLILFNFKAKKSNVRILFFYYYCRQNGVRWEHSSVLVKNKVGCVQSLVNNSLSTKRNKVTLM